MRASLQEVQCRLNIASLRAVCADDKDGLSTHGGECVRGAGRETRGGIDDDQRISIAPSDCFNNLAHSTASKNLSASFIASSKGDYIEAVGCCRYQNFVDRQRKLSS